MNWKKSQGSRIRRFFNIELKKDEINLINNQKLIIICAEPGMGKSEALNHMKKVRTEVNDEFKLWAINIDLKRQTFFIDSKSFENPNDSIDFLAAHERCSLFAKHVLKDYLKNGKVYLLLDGFDEISSDQQDKIILFLRLIKNQFQKVRIVVASREHLKEKLENALSTFSWKLNDFSEENQKKILRKYWSKPLQIDVDSFSEKYDKYIDSIFKIFHNQNNSNFMAIPLHAKLVANTFQEDFKNYCIDDNNSSLTNKLNNLTALFNKFLGEKFNIYLEKKKYNNLEDWLKQMVFKEFKAKHQFYAFELMFKKLKNDSMYRIIAAKNSGGQITKNEILAVGIMKQNSESYNIEFVHRLFAEYFIADLFVDLFKKENDYFLNDVKEFLLFNIFKPRNSVILNFINERVEKKEHEKGIWQNVNERLIFKEKYSCFTGQIIISDYNENKTKNDDSVVDFEELMEKIEGFKTTSYCKPDELPIFDEVFTELQKHNNYLDLITAFETLNSIGNITRFNKLKEKIYENLYDLLQHYIKESLKQNATAQLIKKIESILCLDEIEYSSNVPNDFVIDRANQKIERLNKLINIAKNNIVRNQTIEFTTENMKEEIIFSWILTNKVFNNEAIQELKQCYEKLKILGGLNLFLKINGKDLINEVKRFLIDKKEYKVLVSLLKKFPLEVTLTDIDIEKIYGDKKLDWLQTEGIMISRELDLNSNIIKYFTKILDEDRKINGVITYYAIYIYENLILELLNKGNDSFFLFKLFIRFTRFYIENGMTGSINKKQLETLLDIIRVKIDNNNEEIHDNLCNFLEFCKILKLKVIELNKSENILILQPEYEFEYLFEGN